MSIYVPPRTHETAKAGPVGPGAGVLNTEFLLPMMLPNQPGKRMQEAVKLGREVAYVKAAEATIGGKIADPLLGVGWHIEDPDDETIDDSYPDPRAREAYALIARPQGNVNPREVGIVYSRDAIWEVTSRHMGLAGQGAWYLDQLNDFGIPNALFYLRPDRLTPDMSGSVLTGWKLDCRPGMPEGTPLDLESVLLVQLETPDDGVFAQGLVESALTKALLNGAIDKHFAAVLHSGGRLAGILAPREGYIEDDGIFNQLTRDWRNITEQPESARRLQVARAPIDFTRTVATTDELKLIDLMSKNRDDLLALWRVPLSQLGGASPAGLNSGDIRKFDEAALWSGAVTPRLSRFATAIQLILDRFGPYLGWVPTIEFDIPEFDDDSPRYDKLSKSTSTPLRNSERRALIGLDPFGPDVLGPSGVPLDDEVWMPITIQSMAFAPEPVAAPALVATMATTTEGAALETDEIAQVKATIAPAHLAGFRTSLTSLRANVQRRTTPHLKRSVADILDQQRHDIAARVRDKYDAISRKPRDTSVWWPSDGRWDRAMTDALKPALLGVAETVRSHVVETLGPATKAGPLAPAGAVAYVLNRGAARVTKINQTTRDGISDLILAGLDAGMGPAELGDSIESWSGFDEYRSEMIARTELMDAYNSAAIGSYDELGVEYVEAIDGDEDEECRDRVAGNPYTLDEAASEEDHPNGTLDWIPVLGEG